MSRTAKLTPAETIAASCASEFIADTAENTTALAVLTNQINAETNALAEQLGYDGDLSIGSLEDGIRFYQRRTVEACVELGKRLLLLKQQVVHGEFYPRIALLGLSEDTSYRMMRAAAAHSKSRNLRDLSGKVNSFSSFMELITVDDEDTLKAISELDDIDHMPASELRKAVRELMLNGQATDKLIAAKDKKLNELSRKGQKVAFTDGCHIFSTIMEQIDQVRRQMLLSLGMLDEQMSAVLAVEIDDIDRPAAAHAYEQVARAFNDALQEPQAKLSKAMKRFEDTVALVADEALAA
jgi:hypothetical protein